MNATACLAVLLGSTCASGAWASRVCLLREAIPGLDVARVETVQRGLAKLGHTVSPLTCEELAADGVLSPDRFDALVLTDSPRFPVALKEPLLSYLRAGGDLVLLGGHAFESPVVKRGGRWIDLQRLGEAIVGNADGRQVLFDFDDGDLSRWTRGSDRMQNPTTIGSVDGRTGKALQMAIRNAEWYDVCWTQLDGTVAAGHNALYMWAKGDLSTPQLFVEVVERDGCRWSRAVDLATEWRAAVLSESSFIFKEEGSPAGRGGEGDGLDLSAAVRITVGLARDRVPSTRGDHTLWIDEIGTLGLGEDEELDWEPVGLNVFSTYEPYVLRDAVRAAACPRQELIPKALTIEGAVEGLWAQGFPLPNRQRFVPLLRAEDRHGRDRGWAAGVMVNYAGEYAGSNWLLCGVTSPEFYAATAFGEVLGSALDGMAGDALAETLREEDVRRDSHAIALQSPPRSRLKLSDDRKHFVTETGQRVFLTGCNYIGSFGRRFFGGPWLYYLEDDFRKARAAGINAMRVYGPGQLVTDSVKRNALCELARRYGIYLLITAVDHTTLLTKEELTARVRTVAEAFKGEPMVIGYDLQNEPYTYKVAEIASDGQKLGDRFPGCKQWGDYLKWAGLEVKTGNDFSSFPNVTGPLPVNDEWRKTFDDTNALWEQWVNWQVEAIREVDPEHFITVGYNSLNGCLPANKPLDYVAHHTYRVPYSHEDVVLNLTVLDRLRGVWPDRPICLGEFGYSNGDALSDGFLDFHTSAVGEMMHYLYAFANGYEGVHKWELNDNPLWISLAQTVWIPREARDRHLHQGRFGMYYYDGTVSGRPKPICHALRFFREYLDGDPRPGELTVKHGPTRIGTVYEYRGPDALFVGDLAYESPELTFTAKQPSNMMLAWTEDALRLLSSADAEVELDPSRFVPTWRTVEGRHGGLDRHGNKVRLQLLEGETVTLAP